MKADAMPVAEPAPVLRMLGWFAAGILIAAALLPQAVKLGAPRTAAKLELHGAFERLSPEVVRLQMAGLLDADFYELDLPGLKARVERLPWVAEARIERVWPDTVRVEVIEHQPYARWGESALLSQSGAVFKPGATALPVGLPELDGPPGREQAVRGAFEALSARLARTPFVPVRLVLNARGEWTAWTTDGIELRLGRSPDGEAPLTAAATLAGPVWRALEGRLQEVTYVDLHYIHGFAVGWRDPGPGDRDGPGDPGGGTGTQVSLE